MKLANKYELFDPVTTGRVETFVARDLTDGERVLVHVFESGPSPSDPPTGEWAVQAFRAAAPAPPGAVIDVGRYPGTAYAYLVTKVPEAEALQNWVAAYESYPQQTQETQKPTPVTAAGPAPESGSATAVFSPPSKAADEASATPKPRENKSGPAPVAVPDRISTGRPGSFTSMFQSAAPPAESGNAGVRSSDAKGGEFTSFFRGPFTGKASDSPNATPYAPEPDSRPGEFTQIFGGRGNPQGAPPEPSLRSHAPLNEPGGFTQLFATPAETQTSPGYEPPTFKEEKPVQSENPFVFDKPTWEPQIPTQPAMPNPAKNPFESLPAVIPPLPAGGPSEYTMIVSGGMRAPAAPEEPPITGGSNPPEAQPAGAFAMPKVPVLPPTPVPKLPSAPKLPALAVPKVPKAPDIATPPASYWPLILTLTVLFFIAALLVLYFALKH
jgi:hypothetical protein